MPYKSDAQRKAMHAAAEGRGKIGISRAAAEKFVEHSHGETGPLPEHAKEHMAPKRRRKRKAKRSKRSKHGSGIRAKIDTKGMSATGY